MSQARFDLPRAMLQVLAIGILILATLWIVRPFLVAATWATTIVIATWPPFLRLERLLRGSRALAVATMTLALLLLLVVPLSYGIAALVDNTRHAVEISESVSSLALPAPPDWVGSLPLVGTRIENEWQRVAAMSPDEIETMVAPHAKALTVWIARKVGSIGMLLLNFVLTVLVCAILYSNGESAAHGVRRFAHWLAGDRGVNVAQLAAQAVRGVALGVVVTAALQTGLVGLGLIVVGVPFATLFIATTFVLCIAQVGPLPVLAPVAIWVYWSSGATWGTAFLVWAVLSGLMDNFVRPVLIRRGADLPLLLIFSGVIGGLLAMGVIGLFVGPVVLAVAYTLMTDWIAEDDATA